MRIAALVLAAALLTGCHEADRGAIIDLVDRYPAADKRSTLDLTQAFTVTDAVIEGTSRRVILAHTPSRITWTVDVPAAAQVRAWVALRPDAWDREGDGVVFRIGIAVGDKYDVLARVHVNPRERPGDRRWVPIEAALSPYAGRTAKLVFSTDASEDPSRGDSRNDLALWGDPAITRSGSR